MYFQDEVVQELKQIYAQLEEEEAWDLSLKSLQQVTQDAAQFGYILAALKCEHLRVTNELVWALIARLYASSTCGCLRCANI